MAFWPCPAKVFSRTREEMHSTKSGRTVRLRLSRRFPIAWSTLHPSSTFPLVLRFQWTRFRHPLPSAQTEVITLVNSPAFPFRWAGQTSIEYQLMAVFQKFMPKDSPRSLTLPLHQTDPFMFLS